jgi:c-di-GMP-binding flagellar brake protein YcgR
MLCLTSQRPQIGERRRTPRIGFDCSLRWNDGDGADRTGQTVDMSDEGMGFITRRLSAPKVGQRIHVVLELDDENDCHVDLAATVVRTRNQDHGLCAVGLRLSPILTD